MGNTEFVRRVGNELRDLYSAWGYGQYTMSKFEEYDLYARNKDFLISDNVITFTDLGGKLMALKPDVTLSIVKNTADTPWVQKLFYNENVYRVNKGDHGFREILQLGLECIGPVDEFTISEVLALAAESLKRISDRAVLDISHLGILEQLLDAVGISRENRKEALSCIGSKNRHELAALCREQGIGEEETKRLCDLVSLRGTPSQVMPLLKEILAGVASEALAQLETVCDALPDAREMLRLDFSVVDDLRYYNGIAFKGFVPGIPAAVLSGGQYDKLMKKMKRLSGAVGFAVYMDQLERLEGENGCLDADVLLLYSAKADPAAVQARAKALRQEGLRVLVQREIPENVRYGRLETMEVEPC
jgi:ATP phosphoribosyltransferase regulatory subunit